MFDISEKLITEQSDEIYGVNAIRWVILHGNVLSLIGGEEVVSLSRAKAYVFSDSVLCLCGILKPNFHNQSRQQQPPHKQTRKQELAL